MSVTYTATQYKMSDEVMSWQPPECGLCKERSINYDEAPFGSDYSGMIVCGKCYHKHLDPIITQVLNAQKEERK